MQLQLTETEQEVLLRVLQHALQELRVEVRRTRTPSYHDELASEETLLKRIIGRLEEA